jgi:hypothetical protein
MIIKDIQYTIPVTEVLLRLKYNSTTSEMSEPVRALIDQMMSEGFILAEPRAIIEDFVIEHLGESVVTLCGSSLTLPSAALAERLRGCYKVSLILCTIGNACSEKIKVFLAEKEIAKAAVLDAVASEAVEAVTEAVNGIVNQNAAAENALTRARFSSGYGDWHVREHPRIIETLRAARIGVSVNDASLMVPEKTVSACIGWVGRE